MLSSPEHEHDATHDQRHDRAGQCRERRCQQTLPGSDVLVVSASMRSIPPHSPTRLALSSHMAAREDSAAVQFSSTSTSTPMCSDGSRGLLYCAVVVADSVVRFNVLLGAGRDTLE